MDRVPDCSAAVPGFDPSLGQIWHPLVNVGECRRKYEEMMTLLRMEGRSWQSPTPKQELPSTETMGKPSTHNIVSRMPEEGWKKKKTKKTKIIICCNKTTIHYLIHQSSVFYALDSYSFQVKNYSISRAEHTRHLRRKSDTQLWPRHNTGKYIEYQNSISTPRGKRLSYYSIACHRTLNMWSRCRLTNAASPAMVISQIRKNL